MTSVLQSIDTPAFVVDEKTALQNIAKYQHHCDAQGLSLRPHIKTHKTVYFTHKQLQAGATGITCQKIGEAQVMADAGVEDIFITYNILGMDKLARLKTLANQIEKLSVVADNRQVLSGLSSCFADAQKSLQVLVECDTGAKRCGVQTPAAAVALAEEITSLAGLTFAGLMTYPDKMGSDAAEIFMKAAVAQLASCGIACPVVSTGGSPAMWKAASHNVFTEYRIGTYIYNDRSLMQAGVCTQSDCAGRVLATVVSRPTAERVVIDAGSKVLTSDLLGLHGYGAVVDHPTAVINGLSEEHGVMQVDSGCTLAPGDKIQIIPNHVCVVSNMFDHVWRIDSDGDCQRMAIDARGLVT